MLPGGFIVLGISLVMAVIVSGVLALPMILTGIIFLSFVTAWCAIATNS